MRRDGDVLRDRVSDFLSRALARTASIPELAPLHAELTRSRELLNQPMRVAVVGMIKAGKSTLMNALLGEDVTAVGTVEATFNVNRIVYGKERSLEVHYKDGRPPHIKSYSELKELTCRAAENLPQLLEISYIKVFHPNPLLQVFDLIDTPGLCSHFGRDSENTEEFLRLHGEEITRVTREETLGADAVLYLFSQSVSQSDQEALDSFLGGLTGASPLNAIGVLTKIDTYWPAMDPMQGAAALDQRQFQKQSVRSLFYTVKPVLGHLALGSRTLTEPEFGTLSRLAALPADRTERLVSNVDRLRDREYPAEPDLPPASARRSLADRLGLYGVWLGCNLLRSGVSDQKALMELLHQHSGLLALRELIVSHFGNRAMLIKLAKCVRDVEAACRRCERSRDTQPIVDGIAGECEAVRSQEHAFAELQVLRDYYAGRLPQFRADEVRQMLAVTGEYGVHAAARLELPPEATLAELAQTAARRVKAWSYRVNDPLGPQGATIAAARVLLRSYERIASRIRIAQEALIL